MMPARKTQLRMSVEGTNLGELPGWLVGSREVLVLACEEDVGLKERD